MEIILLARYLKNDTSRYYVFNVPKAKETFHIKVIKIANSTLLGNWKQKAS